MFKNFEEMQNCWKYTSLSNFWAVLVKETKVAFLNLNIDVVSELEIAVFSHYWFCMKFQAFLRNLSIKCVKKITFPQKISYMNTINT